jgi:murein DD-endopeptidase MepM/ murein hydrolase activator NlpD
MRGVALCGALAVIAAVLSADPTAEHGMVTAQGKPEAPGEPLAQIAAVPPPSDAAPALTLMERLTVKPGDTFMKLLQGAAISRAEAHEAIAVMRELFNPRDLRPGYTITATFEPTGADGKERRFTGFSFEPAIDRTIDVTRGDNDRFTARSVDRKLEQRVARIDGEIQSNLYAAGVRVGLPPTLLVEVIRLFSWDVDFQRDIQPGDKFGVLVERSHLKDGQVARWGDILYAELTVSGKTHRLYRFESRQQGDARYFDENGRSVRKALLKTPVDGARLSSRFGKRRHPVLGYTRMHQGVDFAAPPGTPIFAAGNGTIVAAGRNGGYGRYIRIRHNGQYATAYAHLRGFARGIQRGKRVKQGDVIGYVGTSGVSTGPHLHYEVFERGRRVNPLRIKVLPGRNLTGKELLAFQSVRVYTDRRLASLPTETRLTQAESDRAGQ